MPSRREQTEPDKFLSWLSLSRRAARQINALQALTCAGCPGKPTDCRDRIREHGVSFHRDVILAEPHGIVKFLTVLPLTAPSSYVTVWTQYSSDPSASS